MDNNLYFKDTKHRDSKMLLTRCALMTTLLSAVASIPSDPHFFTQLVDHFSVNPATYQQRYYLNDTAFAGTGSPILVIMGGEGAISPSTGIFYPSVVLLSQRFKALIIEPEHRGYGTSQPTPPFDTQRLSLITPQQALADAAALIFSMQQQYNCTGGVGSGPRCPVITIGGSYPGFLSAMMRLRYAGLVDAAYSASSPILLYSQLVDQYQYYKIVTDSAARASAGCPAAVRTMLTASLVGATKDAILAGANLCTPLPPYLESGTVDTLIDEINMVVMYSFANLNMANYPPPNTRLLAACQSIEKAASPVMALSLFLSGYGALRRGGSAPSGGGVAPIKSPSACYNLSLQLPSGPNATISSGDWSGVGSGDDGSAWDWETCTLLVEAIGVNNVTDMFLPRTWTMEWLNAHCLARFGITPTPRALADLWGFDPLRLPAVTSKIVFTNGLNDGWAAGGIQTNLSDTLIAFNMPNGAHHSDLGHAWPGPDDTPDVTMVRGLVADTLAKWIGL